MSEIQSIEGVDFTGKKVLLRVDFNVELDSQGDVLERFKLESSRETVSHILSFPGVKVALLSHFGRPEGKRDEKYSMKPIVDDVSRALGVPVVFVDDCLGDAVVSGLAALIDGETLLLGNARFYPGEESNDASFAAALAAPFDFFVNEAFSVCHRNQASVTAITQFLPSYAGMRLLEERDKLDEIRRSPIHPAVAIIGGAKIETKLPLIREFERTYDAVLVGGMVANEAIDQGITFSEKVLLPTDFQGDGARLDIGPKTTAMFIEIVKRARTIVWNGPMGKFEEKPYDAGTNAIVHAMSESSAEIVVGGGESLTILERGNLIRKVGFVCTGGGAMLEYMSGKELPGLTALVEAAGRQKKK
ncbi:MAG: phosphoglycerate kinase [Candidatus Moranbacteria bacterium]|nr:phosphoglycerate kinase [Candidatus Moranbacteria bacterium]NTW76000.1 phosphoglycerate kinase [Candidatus Moranbacteria bacterium]